MSTRIFTVTFRKRIAETGDKQFAWPQIGRAFENENGVYIDVKVDSLPLNWDGKLRLWLNQD